MNQFTSDNPGKTQGGKRSRLPETVGAIVEFTEGSEKGRRIPLVFERTVIGRKSADILVHDIKVSSSHMAIDYRFGQFELADLGSSNGTYLNGKRITEELVKPGEEVRIGDSAFRITINQSRAAVLLVEQAKKITQKGGGLSELIQREFIDDTVNPASPTKVVRPPRQTTRVIVLEVTSGPSRGKRTAFRKEKILIGRANADLVIQDADVSRRHAVLELSEGNQVVLRDLASANGTFVNDRKISNCVLVDQDRIEVGETEIMFHGVKLE